MNILVLAPHPDDESIGCGGALCRHTAKGDRVVAVFLTSGELGLKPLPREQAWAIREQEAKAAAKILGLAAVEFLRQPDWTLGQHVAEAAGALRPVLERETPQLIYLPHPNEWHPDHGAALPVLRAARPPSRPPLPDLRGYEVWTPLATYDHVEDITAVMTRKLQALRAHRSQQNEFNYARALRGLNQFRGELAAKCRYAEVFQTLPWEAGG
jgi:LmbE family N-acetylglucosaminyl deacetylase